MLAIFSNEYQAKRPDKVNKLKGILDKAQSTGRTLDLGKFEFGKFNSSGSYSALEQFLRDGQNAAYQQVTAGPEQTVTIDGSGIAVKSADSNAYIKLSNNMIALIDDNAKTSRMAMGHFYNTSTKENYYGVLADVIGGTLLAGKNLHMECLSPDGEVTQFKFDGTGAFLNNSRLYLQSQHGRIGLDPNYGFMAGNASLFDVTDTGFIKPSCIDDNGKLIMDGTVPKNVNVWIGIDGQAYFKGNIYANDGVFNGMIYAKGGEFTGTLKATTLEGTLVGGANGGAIEGVSLNIGDGAFTVDQNGNVVIQKGSISWGAVTGTDEIDQRIQNAQGAADHAIDAADDAYNEAHTAINDVLKLAKGTYTKGTFINGTTVSAPEIIGGNIYGVNIYAGEGEDTFARIFSGGLSVYRADVSTPKIQLAVDQYGTTPSIILGSGSGSSTNVSNRMYITKSARSASIFYLDSNNKQCGFNFNAGGTISPIGKLEVTAVFA